MIPAFVSVALEKMDAMLSSDTRWQCQYEKIADLDEMKVSECGESFMTLMMTITGPYYIFFLVFH